MAASPINFIDEMARRLPVWHLDASCRGEDPELWFPGRGEDSEEARKICAVCRVFDECLEEGIRAGMTPSQVAKGQAEPLRATCGHCGALFVTIQPLADSCGISCRMMAAQRGGSPRPGVGRGLLGARWAGIYGDRSANERRQPQAPA